MHANGYVDEFFSSTVNIHSELYLLQAWNDKALAEKFHPQPDIPIFGTCAVASCVCPNSKGGGEGSWVCNSWGSRAALSVQPTCLQCSAEFGNYIDLKVEKKKSFSG